MRFYGNGIVKVSGKSLKFSKPEIRYEKGFIDVEDEAACNILINLGYQHDEEPKKRARKTKAQE